MDLLSKLKNKANLGLSNVDEVKEIDLINALEEAHEVCKNKIVNNVIILDIAYYRWLLAIKKGGLDDNEYDIYSTTLKQLASADDKKIVIVSNANNTKPQVRTRENLWG